MAHMRQANEPRALTLQLSTTYTEYEPLLLSGVTAQGFCIMGFATVRGRCGMSEKMKCARCGKRFKQSNKKQVFCNDCLAKERAAKKNSPQLVGSASGSTAAGSLRRLDVNAQSSTITIVETIPPPEQGAFGSHARQAERRMPQPPERARPDAAPPGQVQSATPTPPPQAAKPPRVPKSVPAEATKRTKQPRPSATPAFALTDDVRAAIEARYLELSQPVEFDGIRTQIAGELNVPKPIVKQVIRELRTSKQLPSWWELQAYRGTDDALARIRERYLPLLPVPPIGVHKQIASELQMDPPQVYQAIRRVRAEMKLPQYNPPATHANESTAVENAESTL